MPTSQVRTRRKRGGIHREDRDKKAYLRYTYQGKRYRETVPISRAHIRVTEIELEIAKGEHTPKKLQTTPKRKALTLNEARNAYFQAKQGKVVEKTWKDSYKPIFMLLARCPYKELRESAQIVDWLENNTTEGMCRRVLMHLSATCKKYCDHNPFDGLYTKYKDPYQKGTAPRCLTPDEISAIAGGMEPCESQLVRFMLLTGCRPGEVAALQWGDLSDTEITFQRRVTNVSGKLHVKPGLKTQKKRVFPMYPELKKLIDSLVNAHDLNSTSSEEHVFKSKQGSLLNMSNFNRRSWKKYAPEGTTPYNCRDTFITNQLKAGEAVAIVAAWVGNSPDVIQKHYMDSVELGKSIPSST